MRVDKFLSAVNIVKKRSIALDMCKSKVILINGIVVKPAKIVNIGDKIEIQYLKGSKSYEVLDIPKVKSTPKNEQDKYIKTL